MLGEINQGVPEDAHRRPAPGARTVESGGVMKRETRYRRVWFSSSVLREAYQVFQSRIADNGEDASTSFYESFRVAVDDSTTWDYDDMDEFIAAYRNSSGEASLYAHPSRSSSRHLMHVQVLLRGDERVTRVEVTAPSRPAIEAVFDVFEAHLHNSRLPDPPDTAALARPTVFLGHGRSPIWRDLKDHLQDQHGYDVEAYEVGARAGHGIRDILEEMLQQSTFAILVMTGDDATTDGVVQPRLNVVHEAGLFQGKLGFNRAVMLVEEGVQGFSNIQGIAQIRFPIGHIKETFGDVLATINREFPTSAA